MFKNVCELNLVSIIWKLESLLLWNLAANYEVASISERNKHHEISVVVLGFLSKKKSIDELK